MKILREKSIHITTIATIEQMEEYFHKTDFGVVLCGRSNVGKSTFINAFFRNGLARTSKTPGKTRDVQVFSFTVADRDGVERQFTAFDLPGFGHARVSKQERKRWDYLIADFFEVFHTKCLFLHLMDAQHPFLENDKMFHEFFHKFDADHWQIFNKIDKLKKQSDRAKFKNILKGSITTSFAISADKKQDLKQLEDAFISYLLKQ